MAEKEKTKADPSGKFELNHMTVITTKTAIKPWECKDVLLKHWNHLMTDNARLLILGGNHGTKSGKLGQYSEKGDKALKKHVKRIHYEKDEDMSRRNISIVYDCISDYLDKDNRKPIGDSLAQVVVEHQPTLLMLASCHTSHSLLNDYFRSHGIYSIFILQKEREQFTEGRCIFLDEEQKSVLLKISEQKPKLVLLDGNFGTGKTVLLMEALRIKISQCKEKGQNVRVLITCDTKQKALIDYLKSNFGFENITVEYCDYFREVQEALDIACYNDSVNELNAYVAKVASKTKSTSKHRMKILLVVDEFFVKGGQDWNKFVIHPNVEVLIALHPRKGEAFELLIPHEYDSEVLHCDLNRTYRNSNEILQLCHFIMSHGCLFKESDIATTYPTIGLHQIKSSKLPPGEVSLWLQLDSSDISVLLLLNYIKFTYLEEKSGVSFIIYGHEDPSNDIKEWMIYNKYQLHTCHESPEESSPPEHSMRGLEDEVIRFNNLVWTHIGFELCSIFVNFLSNACK